MSTWRPWKLYLALEGEPRQLIDTFATFGKAAGAFAEIIGFAGQKVPFKVTIDIGSQPSSGPTARFQYEGKTTPYVIDLVE